MSLPGFSRTLLGSGLLLLGITGCRSPVGVITYHQLHALAQAAPGPRTGLAVEVLPVRLPDMLRRPQVVLPGPTVAGTARWANGLEADVQRVLVANLAALLGSDAVVPYPYGEDLKDPCRVLLVVDQWDFDASGALELRATWILRRTGTAVPLGVRKIHLVEPLADPSPATVVAAQDRLLLALARELAAAVKAVS